MIDNKLYEYMAELLKRTPLISSDINTMKSIGTDD